MAILTPLSLDDARRIGALYGLAVAEVRGILAGSVNSNYALELGQGARVFLRVYEEQGAATAEREAELLDHLCNGGVPTPRPLRQIETGDKATGAFTAEHSGKPVALFPWVAGEILCQARVTPAAARRVGEALARVHVAGASFEGAQANRFNLQALERRLKGVRESAGSTVDPEVARSIDTLGERLERIRGDALRAGAPCETLIHGDLFRDNVLWDGGELMALLDFESASRGSAAFDLAVTLLAWCFGDDLEAELAGALSEGYASVRPLSGSEQARLFHECEAAALRFSITRITDFELRPRESGVYKDYRRFLARQRALDRLGPEGLAAVLRL